MSTETEQHSQSDDELMGEVKNGDVIALQELIRRWEGPLLRYLTRILLNESEAVTVAHDTFVKLYVKRERYQVGSRFSSWLFGIATHEAQNHRRWWRPKLFAADHGADYDDKAIRDKLPVEPVDESPNPDSSAMRSEMTETVRQAIAALPRSLRIVLVLFQYEGKSHKEIACILKITPKAVENRLHRAREKLKPALLQYMQL